MISPIRFRIQEIFPSIVYSKFSVSNDDCAGENEKDVERNKQKEGVTQGEIFNEMWGYIKNSAEV